MALSSVCPKGNCNSTRFESVLEEVNGYKFKLSIIRCASCGAVVSTKEYYNIGALIKKFAEKLGVNID